MGRRLDGNPLLENRLAQDVERPVRRWSAITQVMRCAEYLFWWHKRRAFSGEHVAYSAPWVGVLRLLHTCVDEPNERLLLVFAEGENARCCKSANASLQISVVPTAASAGDGIVVQIQPGGHKSS